MSSPHDSVHDVRHESECNGMCITGWDLGMAEYGDTIAHAHPDCPLHGEEEHMNDQSNIEKRMTEGSLIRLDGEPVITCAVAAFAAIRIRDEAVMAERDRCVAIATNGDLDPYQIINAIAGGDPV